MSPDQTNRQTAVHCYQIRLQGRLDPCWSEWLHGMAIAGSDAETVISGAVPDQPALYGLLNQIRDLGLVLISVERLQDGEPFDTVSALRD